MKTIIFHKLPVPLDVINQLCGGTEFSIRNLANELGAEVITDVQALPEQCDVLISQNAEAFERVKANKYIWWTHHFSDQPVIQQSAVYARANSATVVTLSKCHWEDFRDNLRLDSVIIPHFLPKQIDLVEPKQPPPTKPVLCYASGPYRGLDRFLDFVERFPIGEAHVFGGAGLYGEVERPEHTALYERAKVLGCVVHGPTPRARLWQWYADNQPTMIYPSTWRETYCLTVDEAASCGASVLTSPLAAMRERGYTTAETLEELSKASPRLPTLPTRDDVISQWKKLTLERWRRGDIGYTE